MTDKELLEAEKLIADMRNVLTVLAGTTDEEKLIALVLEEVPPLFDRFDWLGVQRRLAIFGPEYISAWFQEVAVLLAIAQLAQRNPNYKRKLVDLAATNAPRADAILNKVEQALREMASK